MLFRALVAGTLSLALAAPALAADPRQDEQWGLEMVRAPAAWATSTGVGADVAVIDTGVQLDHPDLGGRLVAGFDFVSGDGNPSDGNGHGTHVTGIVAANRDNGEGIAGIAPGAEVLPLRVLNDRGAGDSSDTIRAIDYAIEQRVHVINLSLGPDVLQAALFEDPDYAAALERAVARGIVVVIAAGNDMAPQCENPDVDGILCVGAVDSRGVRSFYSSFGANVDLMAPGGSDVGTSAEDVLSTYTQSGYRPIAGTSQAAPHVAGVAALLASLGVGGQSAVDRIIETAAARQPALEYGAGIVDAEAAVAGLAPPPPDPGDPPAARGSFSTPDPVKRRAVRRRGFRVTCQAARPGRCAVAVYHRGIRIARGGADVPAELPTRVVARMNKAARKRFAALRRSTRVKVSVTLPGEAARTQRVKVKVRS